MTKQDRPAERRTHGERDQSHDGREQHRRGNRDKKIDGALAAATSRSRRHRDVGTEAASAMFDRPLRSSSRRYASATRPKTRRSSNAASARRRASALILSRSSSSERIRTSASASAIGSRTGTRSPFRSGKTV